MRKFLLLLCCLFSIVASSQDAITITGKVLDAETRMPIPGANIIEVGKNNGAITDFDGNFEIEVSPTSTLEISYIGYLTKSVPANKDIDEILLEVNAESLDDVVVVGYGTQKKYSVISYKKLLEDNLKVMDSSAITLARDNNIPMVVFSILEESSFIISSSF